MKPESVSEVSTTILPMVDTGQVDSEHEKTNPAGRPGVQGVGQLIEGLRSHHQAVETFRRCAAAGDDFARHLLSILEEKETEHGST